MKKIRVLFIRNAAGLGFAYAENQSVEIRESLADELVELGVAVYDKSKTSELPADFPGYRALIENGFKTIEQVKSIATMEKLVEIKGIGEKLASSIIEAVS